MKPITIVLKRLGKKKVQEVDYLLPSIPETLEDLITACVREEVEKFNANRKNQQLISFLTPKNIDEQAQTGKIGFGELNNTTLADFDSSVQEALQAFRDGLFVVFVDDDPLESLSHPIRLTEKSSIAFIRMTFLTGTYW
ncbi:MAG: hypothetical protein COA80_06295 [Leeuwenhoekiella sp.]|nr:MAG: hypothetical protein COA80_06295 [Leeuwenhoekiella sp.]